MKKIKHYLTLSTFLVIIFSSFNAVSAEKLFGYNDPPGCGGDTFLPNLVICGRNPASVDQGCMQYTKECNVGDMVETGQRALVWLISIALMIVPLFVMYLGAMIIYNQQFDGDIKVIQALKKRFFEVILYFILMLSAWLIVKVVIDVFQVNDSEGRVPIFLIDDNGNSVKVKTFNTDQ
jgi:hypothetical protein